jgi:hypothetical protein
MPTSITHRHELFKLLLEFVIFLLAAQRSHQLTGRILSLVVLFVRVVIINFHTFNKNENKKTTKLRAAELGTTYLQVPEKCLLIDD